MNNIKLIAGHFVKTVWKSKVIVPIYVVWLALVLYAVFTGYATYTKQNAIRKNYQALARQSWEANPDKHPHRMAHFGSFAFRIKHPLSMFDNGMESYTGNAVFLEAHKQNTANYSEAGFSTGLLRFGEISLAMLLQIVLPLILFFLGFNAVAQQRENATLKILVSQGAGFKQIIWGNSIGLFALGVAFLLPVLAATVAMICFQYNASPDAGSFIRFAVIGSGAVVFIWIISVLAICISAISGTGRSALLSLLGVLLIMANFLTKTIKVIYTLPPVKCNFRQL
jgi:ABC-2 type transport system permease protein